MVKQEEDIKKIEAKEFMMGPIPDKRIETLSRTEIDAIDEICDVVGKIESGKTAKLEYVPDQDLRIKQDAIINSIDSVSNIVNSIVNGAEKRLKSATSLIK